MSITSIAFDRARLVRVAPTLLLLGLTGCPAPTLPPEAIIGPPGARALAGDGGVGDGGVAAGCTPLSGTVTGRIGRAPSLGGGCSTDPQALPLSFHWSLVSSPLGSLTEIHDPTQIEPTFLPDVPGTYFVRLVVSNGILQSDPAEIVVSVDECGIRPPVLTSSATPSNPAVGQAVQLAVAVDDPDTAADCAAHAPEFTYAWQVETTPTGSRATLSDASAAAPSIVADMPGDYGVRVTVTDPSGRSSVSTVTFTAGMCGANAPTGVAAAAPSSTIVGVGVQLQVSMDDTDLAAPCSLLQDLRPQWRLVQVPAGSLAQILPVDAERPSLIPDVAGDYVAEVVVHDSTGLVSRPSRVTVTASPCGTAPPTALAVALPSSTIVGVGVQLQVTMGDPDLAAPCSLVQALRPEWRLVQVPAGSRAQILPADAERPSLIPDAAGEYVAEVVVYDSTGRASAPARVTVSASPCGTARPIAVAQKVGPGAAVTCSEATTIPVDLGGTQNDVLLDALLSSDPDNAAPCSLDQTLLYEWTLLVTPLRGGGNRLRSTDGRTTVLDVQDPGTYQVRLRVWDDTGRVSADTICVLNITNPG